MRENWSQFLLAVKATALQQQNNIKHRSYSSFYIYDRLLTDINVIASICTLNLRVKF